MTIVTLSHDGHEITRFPNVTAVSVDENGTLIMRIKDNGPISIDKTGYGNIQILKS